MKKSIILATSLFSWFSVAKAQELLTYEKCLNNKMSEYLDSSDGQIIQSYKISGEKDKIYAAITSLNFAKDFIISQCRVDTSENSIEASNVNIIQNYTFDSGKVNIQDKSVLKRKPRKPRIQLASN